MAKSNPLRQIWLAAVLLTRLPLPPLPATAFADGARAVWAYPLVGLVVGAGGAAALTLAAPLGPPVAALIALGAMMLLTGAMHEDALADVCDGFWGGQSPARRLEIMRDSQIGSYGVLGLLIVTGLRLAALAALAGTGGGAASLIAAAALSRAAIPAVMVALPHARPGGLSHSVGRPGGRAAGLAAIIGGAAALLCAGAAGLAMMLSVAALAGAAGLIARRKIGGQTGDVLGTVQQLGEVGALLTALALLG